MKLTAYVITIVLLPFAVQAQPTMIPDSSFGNSGSIETNGKTDGMAALLLQSDQKIITAGFNSIPFGVTTRS